MPSADGSHGNWTTVCKTLHTLVGVHAQDAQNLSEFKVAAGTKISKSHTLRPSGARVCARALTPAFFTKYSPGYLPGQGRMAEFLAKLERSVERQLLNGNSGNRNRHTTPSADVRAANR